MARICGDGEDIATCRKFLQGDRVSAMIDTAEGWCEITINGDEVSHRWEETIKYLWIYVYDMKRPSSWFSSKDYAT